MKHQLALLAGAGALALTAAGIAAPALASTGGKPAGPALTTVTVSADSGTIGPGPITQAVACPAGTVVTGGGVDAHASLPDILGLTWSQPGGNGWSVNMDNQTGHDVPGFTTWAVCGAVG